MAEGTRFDVCVGDCSRLGLMSGDRQDAHLEPFFFFFFQNLSGSFVWSVLWEVGSSMCHGHENHDPRAFGKLKCSGQERLCDSGGPGKV